MSHTYSEFLPSYSVGVDCYKAIPEIVKPYGKKAVAVGGKTAMKKSKKALLEGIKGSDIEIIDFVWYGGDSSYENVEKIKNNPSVQKADMVFGIGGGRAVDTAKTYCALYNKPLFAFPTIASNCASCTSLSVMYNPDGTFKEYSYHKAPAIHTFINTKIIAESPEKLMWAGIGDISFGKKALDDCKNNVPTEAIEQVALDIIITAGLVSNFTVHENNPNPEEDYYYNSSLAHCVYYGASLFPQCERQHLHGEIVSFGVLCLLTYDGQFEERNRIFKFNHSIGLPCTLGEIALNPDDVPAIAHKAASGVEWKYVPGNPTEDAFINAILATDKAGKEFLADK